MSKNESNSSYYSSVLIDQLTPKSRKIEIYQEQFKACKNTIRQLKQSSRPDFNKLEQYRFDKAIELEQKRKVMLIQRLSTLGVKVEKRGRPPKPTEQKYEYIRKKFTAKLQKDNMSYLESLKDKGTINSISDFLDELIENHRKKCSFSKQEPMD